MTSNAMSEGACCIVGDLLAERRDSPFATVAPRLAKLVLSMADAGLLYTVLRDKGSASAVGNPPGRDLGKLRSDPGRLLQVLEDQLRKVPATAGQSAAIVLEIRPHEAGFLHRILQNKKRDEYRRQRTRDKHFHSWETLVAEAKTAEASGRQLGFLGDPQDPEAAALQAEVRQVLAELPGEFSGLLAGLQDAGGNVSELARRLGQPQRKTARRVERLRRFLAEKGLSP